MMSLGFTPCLAMAMLVVSALGCGHALGDERGNTFDLATTSPAHDARDLAVLAPPSNRTTATVSYGDAPIARSKIVNRRFRKAPREPGAGAPVGVYFCRDRANQVADGVCVRDPRRVSFRQFYLYTPSYATSPQVTRGAVNSNPVLPPVTSFFYSANSFLFGNPAGE